MKKEAAAALLLVFLIFLGALSSFIFNKEGCSMGRILSYSARAAAEGDYPGALAELSTAWDKFSKLRRRWALFIPESELKELEDSFLSLRAALVERDLASASALYSGLLNRVYSAASSQGLSLNNIF